MMLSIEEVAACAPPNWVFTQLTPNLPRLRRELDRRSANWVYDAVITVAGHLVIICNIENAWPAVVYCGGDRASLEEAIATLVVANVSDETPRLLYPGGET